MSDPTGGEVLRLPPGGGAVTASGTDFDIDLNTGSAGLSLPLTLPAGPNGVRPDVALHYHSGGGADWLGLGWSLSLARITLRPLRSGGPAQPALDGVGELWPRLDGGWAPEVDSLGQRVLGGPDTGWQLVDLADAAHSLGAGPDSRITDATGATVAWLLDSVTDSVGNAVRYAWQRIDGNLRLERISWGRYELHFAYEPRPDTLTDGSLGVLLPIRSRLASIELHRPDLGPSSRLRSWLFGYDDAHGGGRSLLSSASQVGYATDGTAMAGASVAFAYTQPGRPALRVLPRLPVSVRQPGTQFVDLDGDGLPDLLDLSGPLAQYWRNLGGGAFSGPHRPHAVPSPARAAAGGLVFADADGDGAVELIGFGRRFSGYFPLNAAGTEPASTQPAAAVATPFGQPVFWPTAPSVALDDPRTRVLDLDGDGRADLLLERRASWLAWHQDGDGWAPLPGQIPAGDRPPVSLADPRVGFSDLNGDGGLDVVRVTGAVLTYWPALGPRRWGEPISVTIPYTPPRFDPRRTLFVDVDGDGCADLVYLDEDRILLWRWVGTERLAEPVAVAGIPPTGPGAYRLIDLDGSGVPGLLLDLPRGRQGFVELLGGKPYLLEAIDDIASTTRLEWRTSTQYATEDAAAGAPWRTFHPTPVHCIAEVTTTDATTGEVQRSRMRYHEARYDPHARAFLGFARVDRDEIGDATIPTRRTTTTFHLGLDPDDPTRPLPETERRQYGALRRKPLTVTISDPDADPPAAAPESVVRHAYGVVARPLASGRISLLPHLQSTVEERWVGQTAPVSTHTISYLEVDSDGMIRRQRSVVQRPGQPPDRDITTTRIFATGGANLRLPCRTREVAADGTVVTDSFTFFDGPAEVGLPFGTATEGLVTRIEDLVLTDELVAQVWGAQPPDLEALGYHRIDGESGWWMTTTRLDRSGQPTMLRTRGPLGGVCLTERDPTGHDVIAVTDPLGHRQTATYDPRAGQPTALVDCNGTTRRESFDALGRVTGFWGTADPLGEPLVTWTYDSATAPIRVTTTGATEDGGPAVSIAYLDAGGAPRLRLIPTGKPDQPWLVTGAQRVNARGQLTEAFLPYPTDTTGYVPPLPDLPHTSYEYDVAGRPLVEVRVDGFRKSWHRTGDTTVIAIRPSGATVDRPKERHMTDGCGQVLRIGRWSGQYWVEQQYSRDHRGRPRTVTTPDGASHEFVHDLLGRLICHRASDTGTTRRLLDVQGNEVRSVLANGATTIREFDAVCRPTRLYRSGSATPDVVWEYLRPDDPMPADGQYNRIGRPWRITDPLGVLTLGYDSNGRLVHKARSTPYLDWVAQTDVEYDGTGRLRAIVLPAAEAGAARRRVEYGYDVLGRQVRVSDVIDDVEFDAHCRMTRIAHSNGVVTTMGYDPVTSQRTGQIVTGPDGTVLRADTYSYDDERRLSGIAGGDGSGWQYTYDEFSRLASATPAGGTTREYEYSDGGNLLAGPLGGAQTYLPGTSRLATADGGDYGYDLAGRVTSTPWATLTWDSEDNLLSVTTTGMLIEHRYDHAGARVLSQRDGQSYYLRAAEDLIVMGAQASVLIRFGSAVIASADAAGHLWWLHADGLGHGTLVTDETGTVASRLTLDPWGNVLAGSSTRVGAGFLGEPTDPTGLICLGRRWYDPSTGRFLSADPISSIYVVGGWNAYSYALNNPVLLCDPAGLLSTLGKIVTVAVIVAALVAITVATGGFGLVAVGAMAANGGLAGVAIAVGIGAFGGAIAGGMAAERAGKSFVAGAILGGFIGGGCALGGGILGSAIGKGMAVGWQAYAVSGAAQGAVAGWGTGMAAGVASGGKLSDVFENSWRPALWGAIIGGVGGFVVGTTFANLKGEHNYWQVGTFKGFETGGSQEAARTGADVADKYASTSVSAEAAAYHVDTGELSGGDVNLGWATTTGDVGKDYGFITTAVAKDHISGVLLAVDLNAMANVYAFGGGAAAIASASIGADAAGVSYGDQTVMGLKMLPLCIGALVTYADAVHQLDWLRPGVNTFFGSTAES